MTYEEAIKNFRNKMFLSQIEFSKLSGVSFTSLNCWKTRRNEPTIKVKRKLALLFREHGIEAE